jgi:hemoglobin-like flavoprotein
MTKRQMRLIRQSWMTAGEEPLALSILFYDRLFSLSPETRGIFRSPVSQHTTKLMRTVGYILDKMEVLEDSIYGITYIADELVPEGVRAMHYSTIGASLLWAVENRMGDSWNREMSRAWKALYHTLTAVVSEAAQAA